MMDSLSEEIWDLVIAGTSLPQSLLALSLSRSSLKILHVDQNQYYGGSDAGLSIDEAEKWVEQHKSSTIIPPAKVDRASHTDNLAASRAYTLSLNSQIIYASSAFLPAIVTSRLHNQLDFLAVGSWWILQNDHLQRVPTTREDVFANEDLSQRDKFRLMKFLRYVVPSEDSSEKTATSVPEGFTLSEGLSTTFRIPLPLQTPFAALALTDEPAKSTAFERAVGRIRRHMKSMNHFGPGFAAVYPKYAGNAEVAQVACRAGAVGGAVYLLGQGIVSATESSDAEAPIKVQLTNGTVVGTKLLVGSAQDLPQDTLATLEQDNIVALGETIRLNSVSIVSSPLTHLFPQTSDNGPIPAIAIVCVDDTLSSTDGPLYLQIHSEDTGECPSGQCCVYGSVVVRDDKHDSAAQRLESAVTSLLSNHPRPLSTQDESSSQEPTTVLWSMTYPSWAPSQETSSPTPFSQTPSGNIISFPPRTADISFDESVLDSVKAVWRRIMGDQVDNNEFLVFEDRQQNDDQ